MADSLPTLFQSLPGDFASDSPVGTVCVPCQEAARARAAAAAVVVPVHECDLAYLAVTLTRTGVPARKLVIPNDVDEPGGNLRVDVLAHPKDEIQGCKPEDTTQLDLVVTAYASCSPSKHPLLTVTPSAKACEAVSGVKTHHATPLYRPLRSWERRLLAGDSFQMWTLLQWLWGAMVEEPLSRVVVAASTCAIRKAGCGTIIDGASLEIQVYPIESYSLGVSLPPLWSKKVSKSTALKKESGTSDYGARMYDIDKDKGHAVTTVSEENKFLFSAKVGTSSSVTSQNREAFGGNLAIQKVGRTWTGDGKVGNTDRTEYNGEHTPLEWGTRADGLKPWEQWGVKLALKRNGSNLDFELGKYLSAASKLYEAIDAFRKKTSAAIKGEASIGMSVSGEFNLMVVDLTATWQRKEDTGPRAPWNVTVALTGKLIDASLILKYGLAVKYTAWSVEVVNAELSVTVTFSGSVPVAVSHTGTVLDGEWRWGDTTAPIKASLTVSAKGLGTAMVMGQGVLASATATAGVLLDSTLDPGGSNRPPSFKGNVMFTGLSLIVSTVSYDGTAYNSKPISLIDAAPLLKGFDLGHSG